MATEVQNPFEWRRLIVWAITLFLLGLTTARSPLGSGADRFALGLLSGIAWAVVGGAIVAVWKYFKRSTSTITPAELQANDKGLFIAAIVLAVFLVGKALYFETYGALVDAAILLGLGFGVKAGFGPARWGFAIYAIVSPILVMANGGGNAVIWPFVFYYACRSIGCDVAPTTGSENISPTSFAAAPSLNPVHTSVSSASISPREESNHQPMLNHPSPVTPMQATSISTVPQAFSFDEDAVYEVVANEMDSGKMDKGLWTRLYAEHDGDEKKTKIAYIRRRVDQLLSLEVKRESERIRVENEKSIREQKVAAEIKLKSKAERRMQVLTEISKTKHFDEFVDKIRLKSESPALEELLMGEPLWAEAVDSNGNTLLHFAVRNRNMQAVEVLLRYEADPNARNSRGTTPKMEAESLGMFVF